MAVEKWQLPCCALCQITCKDTDTEEEITAMIDKLKEDAKKKWHFSNRQSGERACFVVSTAYELNLKNTLEKLGFVVTYKIPRRNGYPEIGDSEMHMLSW